MEKEKSINSSAIGKALFISIILTFLFILLIALFCYLFFISDKLLWGLVFFATGLSLVLGGLLGFSKVGSKGLLHGGIMGILYILILLLVKLILKESLSFDIRTISSMLMIIFSGLLGGVLGVKTKT